MPLPADLVALPIHPPPWERFFTLAPLVVVGTREPDGEYDLAPKHLAMPLSWVGHFGFVCTPRHRTWHNALREEAFTVSWVGPDHVVHSSLAAAPREDDGTKPALAALPVFPALEVDGVLLQGGTAFLECTLDRVIEDLGEGGLVVGRVVAARARATVLRHDDRDDADLLRAHPLLAYLHPGRIAVVGDTLAYPYHVGFRR